MKLTTFTDYSLRVLIYLALEPERRATIAQVAQSFQVSENHLIKIVHFLGQSGWLANVRGRGGGLALALAPAQINIGAVVRMTEGSDLPAECFDPDSEACSIAGACRLRGVFSEAVRAFYGVLDKFTLADLVQNRRTLEKILLAG